MTAEEAKERGEKIEGDKIETKREMRGEED